MMLNVHLYIQQTLSPPLTGKPGQVLFHQAARR